MKICHINLAKGYRGGERQTEMLIKALSDLGITQKLSSVSDEDQTGGTVRNSMISKAPQEPAF